MSKYSGQCDVYDVLVMIREYTDEELKNNVKVYVGDSETPLELNTQKDLIPYYPHLISCSSYDGQSKKYIAHITKKSSVDYEEENYLNSVLQMLLLNYNRCKRKKIAFDMDAAIERSCLFYKDDPGIKELVKRVRDNGKKASIEGIHLPSYDYFRKKLVWTMIENGLRPEDWGYGRFV